MCFKRIRSEDNLNKADDLDDNLPIFKNNASNTEE